MDGSSVKRLFLLLLLVVMWFGGCSITNSFTTRTEEGYGGEVYVYEDEVTSGEKIIGRAIILTMLTLSISILKAMD